MPKNKSKSKSKPKQDIHAKIDPDLYRFMNRERDRLTATEDGKFDQGSVLERALRAYRDLNEGAMQPKIVARSA